MSNKKFNEFTTAASIARDALFLIWSTIRGRNEQITFDQMSANMPYVRTNQYSGFFGENKTYTKIQEALDSILFPNQPPVISGFSINIDPTLEVGTAIAAGAYTISYNVSNVSNVSGNLTLSNSDIGSIDTTIDPSLTSQGVTTVSGISKTDTGTSTFTLTGTDELGATFSATTTITWKYVRMYFTHPSGDANGELLVGTRPTGDGRAVAIAASGIDPVLDSIIDGTNSDLLQDQGLALQSYPAPSTLGDDDDYRVYFVYQEDQIEATLFSSLGEVSAVSEAFTWVRNGVTENYVIYSINQDYAGDASPQIGVS